MRATEPSWLRAAPTHALAIGPPWGLSALSDSGKKGSSILLTITLTPTPQAEYGHDFNIAFYNAYIGVTIMMLVGFGYLMAFLKCYGLGAVGFTFVITCLALQAHTHTKTDTPSYPSTPILPSRKPNTPP